MTKTWYDKRKHDPEFLAKTAAQQRARYAINKQNPEWVAREAAKRHKKQRDPEWAARRKESKRLYDASVQNDPVKRRKRNELVNRWRHNHKDLCAAMDKNKMAKRKINDPVRVILRNVKCNATRRGIEFTLTRDDIAIPEVCPVLGIQIAPFINGRMKDNNVTIDRINSSRGYEKGNVMAISWLANRIKNDCHDPAVFRKIADYIEENLGKPESH